QIEVVAVNGSLSAKQHAHLIKYDSVHGKFSGDIDFNECPLPRSRGFFI
ncbi:glyceraldehyde 3-phosphate dehydrogenase, partial [Wolbachia endosymbiont of Drosophila ananassae]